MLIGESITFTCANILFNSQIVFFYQKATQYETGGGRRLSCGVSWGPVSYALPLDFSFKHSF